MTAKRLSTGLPLLDRRLGGGFPGGSLVSLTAPPDSQSELLLYEAAAANDCRYLSTLRPADEVRDALSRTVGEAGLDIRQVDADALRSTPGGALDELDGSLVVVDPATELEQGDREAYRAFLDELKSRLSATDSVALLHCHRTTPRTLRRDLTLARADVTLELRVNVFPLGIENLLVVGKFRGGAAPLEPLKLRLSDRAQLDTSRDIG